MLVFVVILIVNISAESRVRARRRGRCAWIKTARRGRNLHNVQNKVCTEITKNRLGLRGCSTTFEGHLQPHPGNGNPSGPVGHGASRPGMPGSPFGPASPFLPRFPKGPCKKWKKYMEDSIWTGLNLSVWSLNYVQSHHDLLADLSCPEEEDRENIE